MVESQKHYIEQKKPELKDILYDSLYKMFKNRQN